MTHNGTVPLETGRLILRRFTPDDADAMFRNWANGDEDIAHYLNWQPNGTTLYAYFDKVRLKIISYIDNLSDVHLIEHPDGKLSRLGLVLSQFRHMYAHIGILNGVTIANTQQYPRVINEGTWCSGRLPEGLYDVEERK